MLRTLVTSLVLLAALSAAGCSGQSDSGGARAELTSHQRDSVLAGSSLPGSATVKRALLESDRASSRAASLDSLAQ